MSNATDLARHTIRKLLEAGVKDFVLSPGSRNAPLSIALYEASSRGYVNLHVKLDERGAAFFALGISKASDKYVAVICTSGSAAANYHPALLEALHSNNKLIAITADRPERLRRTGANQTTDQVGIFPNIRCYDLIAGSDFELTSGPIHLNIQFDDPLLPSNSEDWLSGLAIAESKDEVIKSKTLAVNGNGLIIIGHDRATLSVLQVEKFIAASGLPVISEDPLSFKSAISHASAFLTDEKIQEYLKPDFVIVFGRTTLSRSINNFIDRAANIYVVDPRISTIDTKRTATQIFFELPKLDINSLNPSWISDWNETSKIAAAEIAKLGEWSEHLAISTIASQLPDGSALFTGSSRPIRDLEAFAKPRNGIKTFANRGLAGIDGNLSTIFGLSNEFDRTFAIIGDLTFLHDLTALLAPPTTNLTIFIIDNNGGGIFSTLPQASVVGFEEIFGPPQNQDLMAIISGFGLKAIKVNTVSYLKLAIAHNTTGLNFVVVEVPERRTMAANLAEIYSRISSAVRIGLNLA